MKKNVPSFSSKGVNLTTFCSLFPPKESLWTTFFLLFPPKGVLRTCFWADERALQVAIYVEGGYKAGSKWGLTLASTGGFIHNNLIFSKTVNMLKTLTFAPRKMEIRVSSFGFPVSSYCARTVGMFNG